MTRIIIQNATILTLDDQDTFYYPGSIEIRNDKIFRIGDWSPDAVLDEYAVLDNHYGRHGQIGDARSGRSAFPHLCCKGLSSNKQAKMKILMSIKGIWRQPATLGILRHNLVSVYSSSYTRDLPHRGIALLYHGPQIWNYYCE
jgi:hypothetical protein